MNVAILIKTDLSGFVVTVHEGVCITGSPIPRLNCLGNERHTYPFSIANGDQVLSKRWTW